MKFTPPKKTEPFEPAGQSQNTDYKVPIIHGFPSPFVSSSIKGSKEYGVSYANKMLSGWAMNAGGSLVNSRARKYHISRLYSMGMQSENQYKNIIQNNKRVKTLNIMWRVQSSIPKYLKTLIEMYMELEETPRCTAIDPFSVRTKDAKKLEAERALEHGEFEQEQEQQSGIKANPQAGMFDSQEAINLYYDLFFKQKKELAFEQAIEFIQSENDEAEQKREHLRNFAVYNKSAVKTTLNSDGTITKRVVDIENFVSSFTKKSNYSDICHAGELLSMSISQLRVLAEGDLSEEDLFAIYLKSNNKAVSSPFDQRWLSNFDRPYDDQQIQVFQFEFLTVDRIVKQQRINGHGANLVFNEKDTFKIAPGAENKQLIERNIQYRYSGYYVPSTKQVFKYGRDKMIERSFNMQKLSKCNLTYDVYEPDNYNMNSKSWIEHIISIADMMQVTWLKIQAIVAKAKPAGIAIDIRGLEGVMNGKSGEQFKPLELVGIYEDTGNILYRSVSADGKAYQGKPIEQIANGVSGSELNNLIGVYNQCVSQLQNNTGMNPAADGSLNTNESSVGGAKLMLNQSNRATRYIYEAYLSLLKRSSQKETNQLQLAILYGMNDDYWESAIGKDAVDAIREGNDPLELSDYGIEIEALPDDNKRAEIMQAIQDGVNKGIISQKDAFIIRDMKNYKAAIQYLDHVEKKAKKEAADAQNQAIQQNAQVQQASLKQKSDADAALQTSKLQGEAAKIDIEYTAKDHLQDKTFYQKMVELGKLSLEDYELKFGLNDDPQRNAQAAQQPQQQQMPPEQGQAPHEMQQLPMDPNAMQETPQQEQMEPQMM